MKLVSLSLAVAFLAASPVLAEDFAPCVAPLGEQPSAPGVKLADVDAASAEDLPAIIATNEASRAFMMIYYDAVSERAARSRAACLGAQLAMLEQALGDDRRDVQWSSVAFVSDPDYQPPRGEGLPTRWLVHIAADGSIQADAQRWIVAGIPHEQAHLFQNRTQGDVPRWFGEGHASWVELISPRLQASVAAAESAKDEQALAASTAPLALGAWGGVRPKREAFLRQVSPQDRARMEADPTYLPSGPFRFEPGDLIGDESNMPARYAASRKIFAGLASRHGVEAVKAWAKEITSRVGRVANADIVASAKERFGEDLTPLLA